MRHSVPWAAFLCNLFCVCDDPFAALYERFNINAMYQVLYVHTSVQYMGDACSASRDTPFLYISSKFPFIAKPTEKEICVTSTWYVFGWAILCASGAWGPKFFFLPISSCFTIFNSMVTRVGCTILLIVGSIDGLSTRCSLFCSPTGAFCLLRPVFVNFF